MGSLMMKPGSAESLAIWTKRITDCKNSGMRCQEWCTENGINIKTYYYWHNKIHRLVEEQQSSFYEIPTGSGSSGKAAVTIRVGVFQAEIYTGADAETIRAVCQAMKTC